MRVLCFLKRGCCYSLTGKWPIKCGKRGAAAWGIQIIERRFAFGAERAANNEMLWKPERLCQGRLLKPILRRPYSSRIFRAPSATRTDTAAPKT